MKENLFFKLEPELKKEIERYAKKLSISMSAFIRQAVIEKINKIKGEK